MRHRLAFTLAQALLCAAVAAGSPGSRARAHDAPAEARLAGQLAPQDRPDIVGPGKITRAGNVWAKVTNIGAIGNPFTSLSNDPSAQWPGPSGVEYLYQANLWVAATFPGQLDPALAHRVSQATEWRPPSLDAADRIYEAVGGSLGSRDLYDDDFDGHIDEDRLDGHDNDQDGRVDEDFSAAADQSFSLVMRDDTPEAQIATDVERHVPIGLEAHLTSYSFSTPGMSDCVYFEYRIQNVSGLTLDSVFVGFHVDQDVGAIEHGRYFADDVVEPRVPQGPDPAVELPYADPLSPNAPYREVIPADDPRQVMVSDPPGSGSQILVCEEDTIQIRGFTMTDRDGDGGATPGASSFLLLDHTVDGLGQRAPRRVGFRMFSIHRQGVSFAQGGLPSTDLERFAALASTAGVDGATGLIRVEAPQQPDDYSCLCSVGPFLRVAPGEVVRVVWALAVQNVDYTADPADLVHRYRGVIENAIACQLNYTGRYTVVPGVPAPDATGRESPLRAPPGQTYELQDCRDRLAVPRPSFRTVTSNNDTWFDLDCDWCTGVARHVLKHWGATSPPPGPHLELVPGDARVTLRWDNFSEYVPDREAGTFDFAGYRIWKAAGWKRPQGTVGPGENLWELLGTYHYYGRLNPLFERRLDAVSGDSVTAQLTDVLLNRNWRPGSAMPRLLEARDVPCLPVLEPTGEGPQCDAVYGPKWAFTPTGRDTLIPNYDVTKYAVGRYQVEDRQVLNGFLYLYAITAFDSSGRGSSLSTHEGRRSAIEGEGVIPQGSWSAASNGGRPFVVPNPYRASTSWDLVPSPADPTGKHVDFMNLPPAWARIRVYTVSGDLVQEIRPEDIQVNGKPQREVPQDDQASWNLISRNGQDVTSGIYLFTVDVPGQEIFRGKFVVIR